LEKHQIKEYDCKTIAPIIDTLLRLTPSFEDYYQLKDVLVDSFETIPDVISRIKYKNIQADLTRLITLIAILSNYCSQTLGSSFFLIFNNASPNNTSSNNASCNNASCNKTTVRAIISECEHSRKDLPELSSLTPSHLFEGDVSVCDNFHNLIFSQDEYSILLAASDDNEVLLSIRISLYKYLNSSNDSVTWRGTQKTMDKVLIVNEFRSSCKKICSGQPNTFSEKLFRSINETIFNENQGAVHPLRIDKGGNSPVKKRGEDKAQRRDINYEFHLHYWQCENGKIELASIVSHNDFTIPR
jgi:hypothetical protein